MAPHLILYSNEISPPCRAVLLAGEAMGIQFDIRDVKLLEGETLTEEYSSINLQHTVPTLIDNEFTMWDSHAVMCYLCDTYGKVEKMYPKDLRTRALIHQRLHFDNGILYTYLTAMTYAILVRKEKAVDAGRIMLVKEAYGWMNGFLEGKKWLVEGDHFTIADISCVTNVSSLEIFCSFSEYPNVVRWVKTCEEQLPGFKMLNKPGNDTFCKMFWPLLKRP